MEADMFFDKVIKYCESSYPSMIGYRDRNSKLTLFGLVNTPGLVAFIPEGHTPDGEKEFEATADKIKTLFETYVNQLYETPVKDGILYLSIVPYDDTDFTNIEKADDEYLEFLTYVASIMEKCEEMTEHMVMAQEDFDNLNPSDPDITWH